MWYIILIIVAVVCFFLGYQFALIRHCVKDLKETLSIITSFLMHEITTEEASKRMAKITEKFK